MNIRRNILTALAIVTVTSPPWVANTVKVIESGEGGGPMTFTLDRSTIKPEKRRSWCTTTR